MNEYEAFLKSRFSYNPETGIITNNQSGKPINNKDRYGYIEVRVMYNKSRKHIIGHRLAFFLATGSWPDKMLVDHINGIRADNRICNLRLVSKHGNASNMGCHRHGMLDGVRKTPSGKYTARVTVNRKELHLGTFETELDAYNKRIEYIKVNGL